MDNGFARVQGEGSGSSGSQGLPRWRFVSFPVNTASSPAGAGSLGPAQPWRSSRWLQEGCEEAAGPGSWRDHPDMRPHCPGARRLLSSWAAFDLHLPFFFFLVLFCFFNKDK